MWRAALVLLLQLLARLPVSEAQSKSEHLAARPRVELLQPGWSRQAGRRAACIAVIAARRPCLHTCCCSCCSSSLLLQLFPSADPPAPPPPYPTADYYSSKYNAYYSLQHAGGYYYIWGAQDWCDDLVTVAGKTVGRGQMVLVYYTENAEQVEVEKAILTDANPKPSLSDRRGWVGAHHWQPHPWQPHQPRPWDAGAGCARRGVPGR
jgi:hypothetical protein